VHLAGFIIRIYHDARSHERQINLRHFADSDKCRNNFKQWPLEHRDQVLELRAGLMLIPVHVLQCLVGTCVELLHPPLKEICCLC